MRTVKWNPFLSGVVTLLGGVLLWAGAARADVSSTNPAAIVVFPKLVVDTSNGIDTTIQLTNTADHAVNARCFYVNANGHCSNAPSVACHPGVPSSEFCPPLTAGGFGACIPGWIETDFAIRLTAFQPIVWSVSAGLPILPLSSQPGINGEINIGSIPQANEDPMIGELKCVEVGEDELPTNANDLKGEATIEFVDTTPAVDIEGYNGIGIQATEAVNNDNTLCLGGDVSDDCPNGAEYNACPAQLILDHFFDGAIVLDATVHTDLTLVPCSEDFNTQNPLTTTVQFLVFNEFEQRFSTSRPVTCFSELPLSDIDTRLGEAGDASSIFNIAVEGTLTGQTIIRGVADSDLTHGHGLLGVAEEFHLFDSSIFSAAYMLNQRGTRTQTDIVRMPAPSPAGP